WEFPYETEMYEWAYSSGISPHVGGMHLAALRMAERMATEAGDKEFAEQCMKWFKAGSDSLENKCWLGDYYLRFLDPKTGEKSDSVFAVQLDGEWMARMHGVPGVFRPDRVTTTLKTIERTCVAAGKLGCLHQTDPDGKPIYPSGSHEGGYPATEIFVITPPMLGVTYMYDGRPDLGLEVIRGMMQSIACEQGFTWLAPGSIDGVSGEFISGSEYAFMPFMWATLGALEKKDLAAPARHGGLVDRITRAAKEG
ncbi:MAG: hypothetical protein HYX78_01375, partial [Armatimonadetes bacterium]|nr:hypothetical protein [Armatimonadota bacterium]